MNSLAAGPVIDARAIWRVYRSGAQELAALRGVSLQVARGRFVALKGRSGSGKTTLLNILGGLDQPTSGELTVLGEPIAALDDARLTEWRRDRVGFVFQSFALLPTLSAYENVELMLRIKRAGLAERRDQVLASLALVGLAERHDHRPYELSGGQQQRVAIARALVNQAPLLLADEPTGELDSATAHEILGLFQRIVREQGVTLLMVSHDQLVDQYADEVLHLRDGQLAS